MHNLENNDNTFCGFVAIVGRPNVGKSTLLNYIMGEKISITADKPQTTRHKIIGVKTVADRQALFIDTPGMHINQKKAINREMNKAARSALHDVDAVVFVVEALQWNEEDDLVLECVQNLPCPVFLLVNKIDMIKNKDQLLPHLAELAKKMNFAEIIPCVATKGQQVDVLEQKVFAVLPPSPFLYPADQITDKALSFRLAEIIREKLTRVLNEELPYALSVEIENIKQAETQLVVHAVIWVERESQKGIVIGKHGALLKQIGQQARMDMNHILKTSVHLELWVKVRENWTDDKRALKNLGYMDPNDL
jgi:GTP-binding protein Era